MKNRTKSFFQWLFTCVIAFAFVTPFQLSAQWHGSAIVPGLTSAEWQSDALFLGEEMPKRHRNLFQWLKREDFEAAVKRLHDRIPAMSDDEILVGLMKIAAMPKDGHTSLIPLNFLRSGIFPVRFYLFSDGLFVQSAAPEYADIVGGRVVKIGNFNLEDALKAVGQIISADNDMGRRDLSPRLLAIPEILAGLKITDNKQNLKLFVETGGKEKQVELKPTATLQDLRQQPASWINAAALSKNPTPLYLKDLSNLYWFEYLKDKKLLYVQQNAVQNKPDEPAAVFYKRVFDFVEANPVEKFVLDLRNNGGGNNGLNRQVVIGLIKSKINERGKLFVITGRRTFSAAQNLVNEIEKYTNAIFVGEPTAGRPNHYGDARTLVLPNSKLDVRISTIWWQDADPRDTRLWTAPEISVELSSEDFSSNYDAVLQAVIAYSPGKFFSDLVSDAATQNYIAGFIQKYKAFKTNMKNKFVNTEAAMNRFGYQLLQRQKLNEAIEVFKLNVEAYPNSANVYDSLGEAYMIHGNRQEAVKNYEKVLKIDPNYQSAIDALKRLKSN